jgi:acetoin utilization protein AcuC
LAVVSGRDIDPAIPLSAEWLKRAADAASGTPLPTDMSDGTTHPVPFRPWDGGASSCPLTGAIMDTLSVVYPLHGLDPQDPMPAVPWRPG